MRGLYKTLIVVGVIAAFVGASVSAYLAWQIALVSSVAKAEPQEMTAGHLIDNGPGDNRHVTLSDFTFGKPVIEANAVGWANVWVPVLPRTKTAPASKTTLFYRPAEVRNKAQLEELLRQDTLDLIVANSLPDMCLFQSRGNVTLWQAQPKIDATAALILTEPQLRMSGQTLLTGSIMCGGLTSFPFWGGALTFLGLAAGGIFLVSKTGPAPAKEAVPPQLADSAQEPDKSRLLTEISLSVHHFQPWTTIYRSSKMVIGLLLILGASLVGFAVTIGVLLDGHTGSAIIGGSITLALFAVFLYFVNKIIASFTDRYDEIHVCGSGLRWLQHNKIHAALWTDIKLVHVEERLTTNRGQVVDQYFYLTIGLHEGGHLLIHSDHVSDFKHLAEHVASNYNMHNAGGNNGPDLDRAFKSGNAGGRWRSRI